MLKLQVTLLKNNIRPLTVDYKDYLKHSEEFVNNGYTTLTEIKIKSDNILDKIFKKVIDKLLKLN